eukprot:6519724-Prymnesium_polylepis.2
MFDRQMIAYANDWIAPTARLRATLPAGASKEVEKAAAAEWKNLSAEERAVRAQRFHADPPCDPVGPPT